MKSRRWRLTLIWNISAVDRLGAWLHGDHDHYDLLYHQDPAGKSSPLATGCGPDDTGLERTFETFHGFLKRVPMATCTAQTSFVNSCCALSSCISIRLYATSLAALTDSPLPCCRRAIALLLVHSPNRRIPRPDRSVKLRVLKPKHSS